MKRQLVVLALLVSLALNLFFLAGFLDAWWTERESQGPIPRRVVLDRLHLSADQRRLFEELASEMRNAQGELSAECGALSRELWGGLGEEPPDEQRLEVVVESLSNCRLRYSRRALHATVQLLNTLNAEQRETFRKALRNSDALGVRGLWRDRRTKGG